MQADKITYASILYLVGWCISPPLAYGVFFRILAILAVITIAFLSIGNNTQQLQRRFYTCVCLCLYMGMVSFITGENFAWNLPTYVVLFSSVIIALWNNKYGFNNKQLKNIIFFALCLYCIWNTTTLIALASNDRIMRELVRNSSRSVQYAQQGVGGYGYLYSVIIMLPIGLYMYSKRLSALEKWTIIYFIISSALLVYQSQYLIALILMVLIIPMMYIARKNNGIMGAQTLILTTALLILIFVNLEPILDFFINIVDIPSIHRKLLEMKMTLLLGGDVEDSEFGERYERYSRDLILISESPLWGVFKFSLIGKHSSILDFCAQYGLPLGIVYMSILFSSCRDWIKRRNPAAMVLLCISVIIALMNPIPLAAAVPLCIVLPIYCKSKCLKS